MSICIGTSADPCCCSKARVKYCSECKRWICRWYINYHECQRKYQIKEAIVVLLGQRIAELAERIDE